MKTKILKRNIFEENKSYISFSNKLNKELLNKTIESDQMSYILFIKKEDHEKVEKEMKRKGYETLYIYSKDLEEEELNIATTILTKVRYALIFVQDEDDNNNLNDLLLYIYRVIKEAVSYKPNPNHIKIYIDGYEYKEMVSSLLTFAKDGDKFNLSINYNHPSVEEFIKLYAYQWQYILFNIDNLILDDDVDSKDFAEKLDKLDRKPDTVFQAAKGFKINKINKDELNLIKMNKNDLGYTKKSFVI